MIELLKLHFMFRLVTETKLFELVIVLASSSSYNRLKQKHSKVRCYSTLPSPGHIALTRTA